MTSPGAFHAMPDAFHAIMYSRYMAETGADRSHLAEISIAFRQHAGSTPLP
jgi:acetyl-CoA acetyltransferase